jgi:hypothetical protein
MPIVPNIDFPDYEFVEYPKMVYPGSSDGKPKTNGKGQSEPGVLVNNAAEEAEVMATGAAPVRDEDEQARLQTLCEINGVQFDKRWGAAKLTKALTEAGHDPTADPFS